MFWIVLTQLKIIIISSHSKLMWVFFQHFLWIVIPYIITYDFCNNKKQTKASNLLSTTQMENKTWEYPSKIKNCDFGIVHTSSSNKKLLFCSIENYFQDIHNIELRIHTPPPHPSIHSSTPLYFNISLPSGGMIPWGTMGWCWNQCTTRGLWD